MIDFHPIGPQTYPVHIYDFCCDQTDRMKPSYLLRWMEEFASAHVAAMGLGRRELMEADMVFLLSRMTVRVTRMPQAGEDVEVTTWERGASGPLYNREFSVRPAGGEEPLAEATTQWMLVNPTTRRILRPKQVGFETPKQPFAAAVEDLGRLKLPVQMAAVGERVVRYADIDRNGHLNNAVYADILCDYSGVDLTKERVSGFYLSFVHEALPGQTLQIATAREQGRVLMEGRVGETICFEGILDTVPVR
ncbi:acyl-[acyl-carrier-protein] thioesterase [Zongyangia hominis]|uniref:Acyl-ACP thioesterase n=1 Tax=Zongyangia hominis TaxID=2763677 RepID=A0A926EEE5_9FIRM|nr:acyl-ACP thioesterase domain-containing protein [Zongyangia hominis]MBC8570654.1 hypothetical protein [Zongyangia hominis]